MLTACGSPAADFTLTLGGDIMLARNGNSIYENDGVENNPWSELQRHGFFVEDSSLTPDFFFANLESPLGSLPTSSSDMNLCSDPDQLKVIIQGGVDLVSLANNHRDDCSTEGSETTQSYLEAQNIKSAKMGGEPVYLDSPNGKMAILAAEDVTGALDVPALLTSIKEASEKAQIVVVAMHWGNEYQAGPDERQQTLAQQLADAGADVIWGHHPHVLQKMQWLESADGRQVLVLYSLGNLLTDQWMLEDAQRSALVRLSFKKTSISEIEIIPLEMDRSSKSLQLAVTDEVRKMIFERLGVNALTSENVVIRLYSPEP